VAENPCVRPPHRAIQPRPRLLHLPRRHQWGPPPHRPPAPPPGQIAPEYAPCTSGEPKRSKKMASYRTDDSFRACMAFAVQQRMFVNCLADLDDCSKHLEAYLTVVGDCTDNTVNTMAFAKNAMRSAVTAYYNRPSPPPPPSCDIDTLQSSFQVVENACCVGVRYISFCSGASSPLGESNPMLLHGF
jgi:hypothetical protein